MKKIFLTSAICTALFACTTTGPSMDKSDKVASAPVTAPIKLKVMPEAVASKVDDGDIVKVNIKDAFTPCNGDLKGKTDTMLKYGMKHGMDDIDIKWRSYVGENTEFRINLKPKSGYDSSQVKIIGKWGKKPDGSDASIDWMNVQSSAKDLIDAGKKPVLILCVPSGVPEQTEYKFDVHVVGLGEIDPRAVVVW